MDIFQLKADPRTDKITSLLRYTPSILLFTTLTAITTLGLSCAIGYQRSQLTPAPYESSPTTAQIIFYETTTPFLSLIHSILSFTLPQNFQPHHHPLTSLIPSTLLLLGWIIQFSFWTTTDLLDGTALDFARWWPMARSPGPLYYARFSFALLGLLGYAVLVGVVGVSVLRERRAGGKGVVGGGDGAGSDGKSGEFGLE